MKDNHHIIIIYASAPVVCMYISYIYIVQDITHSKPVKNVTSCLSSTLGSGISYDQRNMVVLKYTGVTKIKCPKNNGWFLIGQSQGGGPASHYANLCKPRPQTPSDLSTMRTNMKTSAEPVVCQISNTHSHYSCYRFPQYSLTK